MVNVALPVSMVRVLPDCDTPTAAPVMAASCEILAACAGRIVTSGLDTGNNLVVQIVSLAPDPEEHQHDAQNDDGQLHAVVSSAITSPTA